jgi:hypothetical protein
MCLDRNNPLTVWERAYTTLVGKATYNRSDGGGCGTSGSQWLTAVRLDLRIGSFWGLGCFGGFSCFWGLEGFLLFRGDLNLSNDLFLLFQGTSLKSMINHISMISAEGVSRLSNGIFEDEGERIEGCGVGCGESHGIVLSDDIAIGTANSGETPQDDAEVL